ncbi:capsular exopolysaccharide synthesis family protein [Streptomyces canus]|uniref:polysaccharide biosynthesis tyrosine autokinase n=1 Tax=Streptomyces canus TaxID=58343 RepID=UPI002782BC4D|nr:polysaccharide biosynthesis tyrosine autokinase [Streptomyces canus]MDQ0597441.1 capsular exopolysaccharide synthesis family protein [Streptomyces canus]
MDFHELMTAVRRRWRFVILCVLLGLAGAAAATALMPRTYTATAQLFVSTRDKASADAYQGSLFTQQRVKSYTHIVTTPAVLDGVISRLDLHTTPGHLSEKISAHAPLDTTLVDIRVTDGSATRAQAIADETARQFTTYISTVEGSPTAASPLVKADVVGGSQPPSAPTSPRPAVNTAIGLFAGVVLGVGGALLRHSLDTTLRSSDDIGAHLGLTTLGVVPPPDRRHLPNGPRAGTSRREEALSQLRTRLGFAAGDDIPGSLLIASALRAEGRTRTAVDLATAVARTGKRVILLEADLRRPRLTAELGLRGTPGLTGVLRGGTPLYAALESWEDGRIRVLPSGNVPADPNTLLSGPDMVQLVRALEADADLVVVDSPPLLSFADGATLAAAAEGVLFVARAGKTHREDALRALDTLSAVRARVLGAVLTGTRAKGLAHWKQPRGSEPPDGVLPVDGPASSPVKARAAAPGRQHEQAG